MAKPEKKKYPHLKNAMLFFFGLLLCLLIYEVIALSTNQLFLPEFFKTLGTMFSLLGTQTAWISLGWSLLRIIISFSISGLLGVVLGLLSGYFPSMGKVLQPGITILRSLPTIAVLLLLVVFVPHFSLYVVGLALFPVIYQATFEGSSRIYKTFEYDLLLKGRRHWLSNITRIIFPLSMDYILLGFIQALGMGFKVEIMSETFAYNSNYQGLGKIIKMYSDNLEYEKMVAYVLLAIITSLILDGLLLLVKKQVEKKIGISKEENSTDLVLK
ncbi:MAG: ABC transporter permease subunit [Bacilli bacterium]|jgi:NitT/TauT family transport system permease protein